MLLAGTTHLGQNLPDHFPVPLSVRPGKHQDVSLLVDHAAPADILIENLKDDLSAPGTMVSWHCS